MLASWSATPTPPLSLTVLSLQIVAETDDLFLLEIGKLTGLLAEDGATSCGVHLLKECNRVVEGWPQTLDGGKFAIGLSVVVQTLLVESVNASSALSIEAERSTRAKDKLFLQGDGLTEAGCFFNNSLMPTRITGPGLRTTAAAPGTSGFKRSPPTPEGPGVRLCISRDEESRSVLPGIELCISGGDENRSMLPVVELCISGGEETRSVLPGVELFISTGEESRFVLLDEELCISVGEESRSGLSGQCKAVDAEAEADKVLSFPWSAPVMALSASSFIFTEQLTEKQKYMIYFIVTLVC